MPARFTSFAVACGLLIGLASCGAREAAGPALEITMQIEPDPPRVGDVTIDLELKGAGGAPVRAAQVALEGNMTHPGMTPSFAEAREVAPGRYRARLVLTMAGDWVILVDARFEGGATAQRSLPLRGVRPR